jgi:hypothetical protein
VKLIALLIACLAFVSCASRTIPSRTTRGAPELSVVHLSGKITQIPKNSKWPASIKVGATIDYWAVIDNRVPDTASSPHQGSYLQKTWPSRYDLRVGDFRFSSDRLPLTSNTFVATLYDEMPGNDDGYTISSMYHTTLTEAPELESIHFTVNLRPQSHDIITSKKLPLHPIAVNLLTGGGVPHFRGVASLKSDYSDQTFSAKADTFEVYQACADTPIGLRSLQAR